jgi:hypothetical protein
MSGESKGVVGSLAVHAGILAVLVGASWYASRQTGESLEAVDPLIVTLDGIPGKKAGHIGKAPGVAQGDERGVTGGIPRIHLKKLDLEKVEQERQKVVEQATQGANSSTKSEPRVTSKNVPGGSSKVSLADFQKANPGRAGGSASGKVGTIGGSKVAIGRNYGTGENGGDGGAASERQLYAGEVKARFQSAWTDLLAAEGATLESAGSCGVSVRIDAAGGVAFSGWLTAPRDARFAQLVKQAVSRIGNCGKPPGGKGFVIDFPKVGASEG